MMRSLFSRLMKEPPVAPRVASSFVLHGRKIEDPYLWMQTPNSPELRRYLEEENRYCKQKLSIPPPLRSEFLRRMRRFDTLDLYCMGETQQTVLREYGYFSRTYQGNIQDCRQHRKSGQVEVLLDRTALAEKVGGFAGCSGLKISPNDNAMMFGLDVEGTARQQLILVDLALGWQNPVEVLDNVGTFEFASNGDVLFTRFDDVLRPAELWHLDRVTLKTSLLYTEHDSQFVLGINVTKDNRVIAINSNSKDSSEVRLLDSHHPHSTPRLVHPRGHCTYFVEHFRNRLFIFTNDDGCFNFKVVSTPVDTPTKTHWTDFIPHSTEVMIEDADVFDTAMVLFCRRESLPEIRAHSFDSPHTATVLPLATADRVVAVTLVQNPNPDAKSIAFHLSSPIASMSRHAWDFARNELKLLQAPAFSLDQTHVTRRVFALAADGARIPITLTHHRNLSHSGRNNVLLFGYGAYAETLNPVFEPAAATLLSHGFVLAHCHVRGGKENGYEWAKAARKAGRLLSFSDLESCCQFLFSEGITSPGRLAAIGTSAGGLLFATVANRHADWFSALVLKVPFVDVLCSMMDPGLALTSQDEGEWGNPRDDPAVFESMLSYSPVQNVTPHAFPDTLITAALLDEHAPAWQAAKYVAQLRAAQKGAPKVFLQAAMAAGHHGPESNDPSQDALFILKAFSAKNLC
eukprot:m.130724 g.130724  ORF g.130724 m.130724 type:complete len:687 (-) comp14781_c0_seq4:20-2080(-)